MFVNSMTNPLEMSFVQVKISDIQILNWSKNLPQVAKKRINLQELIKHSVIIIKLRRTRKSCKKVQWQGRIAIFHTITEERFLIETNNKHVNHNSKISRLVQDRTRTKSQIQLRPEELGQKCNILMNKVLFTAS